MLGECCIKHWSKTQGTISLSSGEAELHGITYGAAQALGLQSLLKDAGWQVPVHLHSDATAAIGIARRKGLGKIRHLDTTDLWIQDKIRSKKMASNSTSLPWRTGQNRQAPQCSRLTSLMRNRGLYAISFTTIQTINDGFGWWENTCSQTLELVSKMRSNR